MQIVSSGSDFMDGFGAAAKQDADEFKRLDARIASLEKEVSVLRHALEMVRDADNDCRKDGLQTMPSVARATIELALSSTT